MKLLVTHIINSYRRIIAIKCLELIEPGWLSYLIGNQWNIYAIWCIALETKHDCITSAKSVFMYSDEYFKNYTRYSTSAVESAVLVQLRW